MTAPLLAARECPECRQRGYSGGRSTFLQCPSGHIWTRPAPTARALAAALTEDPS